MIITFEDFQYILGAIISITLIAYVISRIVYFVPDLIRSFVVSIKNKSMIYDNNYLDFSTLEGEKHEKGND